MKTMKNIINYLVKKQDNIVFLLLVSFVALFFASLIVSEVNKVLAETIILFSCIPFLASLSLAFIFNSKQ